MIPDFQSLMLPVLRRCSDGEDHSIRSLVEFIADEFGINAEEVKRLLPSGRQAIINNRIGWAVTYLRKAGLLESPRRGHSRITERGRNVLINPPERITIGFLEQFEEFATFRSTRSTPENPSEAPASDNGETPEEALEIAYQRLRRALVDDLVAKVKECSPAFFEKLVVEVLLALGYGGSRKEAGERVGKAGDGGIDGIIKEDRLGLDIIYIQAKRWDGVIGRPEVQKFVGALQGQRARKGVFITTSSFTKEARDYAALLESKVILVEGTQLAEFMVDFNIGVTSLASYEIKRIDSDYFLED